MPSWGSSREGRFGRPRTSEEGSVEGRGLPLPTGVQNSQKVPAELLLRTGCACGRDSEASPDRGTQSTGRLARVTDSGYWKRTGPPRGVRLLPRSGVNFRLPWVTTPIYQPAKVASFFWKWMSITEIMQFSLTRYSCHSTALFVAVDIVSCILHFHW